MTNKRKGFTVAEVMITLLIVGIVGAATIPTVTKRQTGKDGMWDWASYPTGATYTTGTHVVLDGTQNSRKVPAPTNGYFPKLGGNTDESKGALGLRGEIERRINPSEDKLIIVNNASETSSIRDGLNANITKPHISFYTQNGGNIRYAGALTSDLNNLSLGTGALQSMMTPTDTLDGAASGRNNVAIGNYALFSDRYGRQNTVLGDMALSSLGFFRDNTAVYSNNVVIGANAQKYSQGGIHNTVVGANALNSTNDTDSRRNSDGEGISIEDYRGNITTEGSDNIALGYNALASFETTDRRTGVTTPNYRYGRSNIGIGANSGFVGNGETGPTRRNSIFIGSGDNNYIRATHSVKTGAHTWDGNEFNFDADELIVNTADGKHTILKIRMINDTNGVALPTIKSYSSGDIAYDTNNLGYCVGVGSDDLANPKKATSLAEVCIAKFSNGVYVQPSTTSTVNVATTINDWDIYIKDLIVATDGGMSTGTHDSLDVQTVKAALNYTDRYKESSGILGRLFVALFKNLGCFFGKLFPSEAKNCNFDINSEDITSNDPIGDFFEKIESIFENPKDGADVPDEETVPEKETVPDKVDVPDNKDDQKTLKEKYNECFNTCSSSCRKCKPLYCCGCRTRCHGEIIFRSDKRLKNVSGKNNAGLKEINSLRIKNYTYKADKEKTPHVGVIAQELQKVFPNSVVEGPDGYLRIKQEEMFYAMLNATKELKKQDEEIKTEIPKINKEITSIIEQRKVLLNKKELLKKENEKLQEQLKSLQK